MYRQAGSQLCQPSGSLEIGLGAVPGDHSCVFAQIGEVPSSSEGWRGGNAVLDPVRKVQWSLCKKKDVAQLQAEDSGHVEALLLSCSSMNYLYMPLATLKHLLISQQFRAHEKSHEGRPTTRRYRYADRRASEWAASPVYNRDILHHKSRQRCD